MVTLIHHGKFSFHLILSIFRIPFLAYLNQPGLEQVSESLVSNSKHSLDHFKTPILHVGLELQRGKYLHWSHICHISAEKMKKKKKKISDKVFNKLKFTMRDVLSSEVLL